MAYTLRRKGHVVLMLKLTVITANIPNASHWDTTAEKGMACVSRGPHSIPGFCIPLGKDLTEPGKYLFTKS